MISDWYASPQNTKEGDIYINTTREEKMDGFLQEITSEPIKEDNNSDTVRIRFKDGGINDKATLPDISYEHFLKFMFHIGDSDTEYFKYLREHNMKELTNFNKDGIENLYLVVEDGFRQRKIVFKAVYDSYKQENHG